MVNVQIPPERAAATITGQTSASSVIDNRQARTGRLNQSVVAAG